ncbi:50S ribosomal protein L18 [Candidatus Falkowbacteria bacterium]|nr:50S ribosomal protein L18 [Candidatus Falkowbacteria bacterium]
MASKELLRQEKRKRRHQRSRAKISGSAEIPRFNVYKSLSHVYAQLIDDKKGVTLASAKDGEINAKNLSKTEISFKVGELIGAKAQKAGINQVVFDKGGFKYHGRVKAVAEGARKAGLKF